MRTAFTLPFWQQRALWGTLGLRGRVWLGVRLLGLGLVWVGVVMAAFGLAFGITAWLLLRLAGAIGLV